MGSTLTPGYERVGKNKITGNFSTLKRGALRACFENGKLSIISKLLMLYNITLLS